MSAFFSVVADRFEDATVPVNAQPASAPDTGIERSLGNNLRTDPGGIAHADGQQRRHEAARRASSSRLTVMW